MNDDDTVHEAGGGLGWVFGDRYELILATECTED